MARNIIRPLLSSTDVMASEENWEVFGFAPYWTISKMDDVDWNALTTFAYFSIPLNTDGSFDTFSYEYSVLENGKVDHLFEKAKQHGVRRVVTLTEMDAPDVRAFLDDPSAWDRTASDSVNLINSRKLDGINIDIEYMPSDAHYRDRFSQFISRYSTILNEQLDDPYITVSVIASSEKDGKIYDIGRISKDVDGIFMMAYDFYYPGSEKIGPSAPLYGYNGGSGPFWYDVSTAVNDFLRVAPSNKIILGIPYYGWNYPAYTPEPNTDVVYGSRGFATTNEKVDGNQLLTTTPLGGWDDLAKVSWRGYWDENGWHVVYMEDQKSLEYKFDFAKNKKLAGVGFWALGFDAGTDANWQLIREKFSSRKS